MENFIEFLAIIGIVALVFTIISYLVKNAAAKKLRIRHFTVAQALRNHDSFICQDKICVFCGNIYPIAKEICFLSPIVGAGIVVFLAIAWLFKFI